MPQMSTKLAQRVAARHGIITTDQLLADGLTRNAVRRMVSQGAITRCHNGVYRLTTSLDTFEARCAAACAADRTAVITGLAAGRLWRFPHVSKVEQPILLVRHDRWALAGGVLTRRSNVLPAEDQVTRPDGIRVASPPRAWFDCAIDVDDDAFEMLTEHVLDRYVTVGTLWRMHARLAGPGRPGLARVTRVLGRRPGWQRPAGSGLELRVLRALEQRGVGGLARQHAIRLLDGEVVHPDGALPDIKWALEVDHVTWHGGRFQAQYDKVRDRKLRRVGWQVDRVTDAELSDHFDAVIDELVVLIAERRAAYAVS